MMMRTMKNKPRKMSCLWWPKMTKMMKMMKTTKTPLVGDSHPHREAHPDSYSSNPAHNERIVVEGLSYRWRQLRKCWRRLGVGAGCDGHVGGTLWWGMYNRGSVKATGDNGG